eukprot:14808974-Alexandrium_andersonii.AAC.1
MDRAMKALDAIAILPANQDRRATMAATRALPAALYACEVAAVPDDSTARLRGGVIRAIAGKHAPGRAGTVLLAVHSAARARHLEPDIEILHRR